MRKEISASAVAGSVKAKDALEWRRWLKRNHEKVRAVWLVYFKAGSGVRSVKYNEALEEALCYGWIDSKVQRIDEKSYRQYYSKRKAGSSWSKVNKAKAEKLIAEGRMQKAGFESIEIAKKNGSWDSFGEAEELEMPAELDAKLKENPAAAKYFNTLSRTAQRNFKQYIATAKLEETRHKRAAFLTDQFAKNLTSGSKTIMSNIRSQD